MHLLTVTLYSVLAVQIAAVVNDQFQLQTTDVAITAERKDAITLAIVEAKEHNRRQSLYKEVTVQVMSSNGMGSGAHGHHSRFKRPSKEAVRQGEARLLFEDMLLRADRKLTARGRKSNARVQSAEARAEQLAEVLFHTPGSNLTDDEVARMFQESGCREIREEPHCAFAFPTLYRSIDGTCNNCNFSLFGASGTPFTRILPAKYDDCFRSIVGSFQAQYSELFGIDAFAPPHPSARHISNTMNYREENAEEQPFTHMVMQWGQFLDHDTDLTPEEDPNPKCSGCTITDSCKPIAVKKNDRAFGVGTKQNGDCLKFVRSLPACGEDSTTERRPREQLNDITSFIDGSQVYGSTATLGNALRSFIGGHLLEGELFPQNKPALPKNRRNSFIAGDTRVNEHIALTIMHTLWLREHNRIARQLEQINPFWGDERLFQEARKIVGALIQKITFDDYLPKVLGPLTFNEVIGPYSFYNKTVNPGIPNSFATAAYRYGHSLVRPMFSRLRSDYTTPIGRGHLHLADTFFKPEQFKMSFGTDPIMRGLLTDNSNRFDGFLNSVLTTGLFKSETAPGMDLAALNIQRGRDHALPSYPFWVDYCRSRFPNLPVGVAFQTGISRALFQELYGSLETVDLWIAGLAERRLPQAFFGATFACIFGITFSNVRNGDRFWYEKSGVFTPRELAEIKKGSLSRVICDNSDNIDSIQPDAFLSNQTRVNCNSLPRVNLQEWRESACFFNIAVKPERLPITVSIYSLTPPLSFTSHHFESAPSTQYHCMPVACPGTMPNPIFVMEVQPGNSTATRLSTPKTLQDGIVTFAIEPQTAQTYFFTDSTACETTQAQAIPRISSPQGLFDANVQKSSKTPKHKSPFRKISTEDMKKLLEPLYGGGHPANTKLPASTGTKIPAEVDDSDKEADDSHNKAFMASRLEEVLKELVHM